MNMFILFWIGNCFYKITSPPSKFKTGIIIDMVINEKNCFLSIISIYMNSSKFGTNSNYIRIIPQIEKEIMKILPFLKFCNFYENYPRIADWLVRDFVSLWKWSSKICADKTLGIFTKKIQNA